MTTCPHCLNDVRPNDEPEVDHEASSRAVRVRQVVEDYLAALEEFYDAPERKRR